MDDFSRLLNRYNGFRVSDVQMPKIAHAVKVPTMLVQVLGEGAFELNHTLRDPWPSGTPLLGRT